MNDDTKWAIFQIAVVAIFVIMFVWLFSLPSTSCDKLFPTAGQIVDCIATRTAEARTK